MTVLFRLPDEQSPFEKRAIIHERRYCAHEPKFLSGAPGSWLAWLQRMDRFGDFAFVGSGIG